MLEEIVKTIKKEFYAYRNGIVADALRASGDPHQYIMGCQLVDVMEIARHSAPAPDLAVAMWSDKKHRECRMIAPMLYPAGQFSQETALQWCLDIESTEIADVLCHSLLRKLDFAQNLFKQLLSHEAQLVRYTAFRLLLNLLMTGNVEPNDNLKVIVENELTVAPAKLQPVLGSILEEL